LRFDRDFDPSHIETGAIVWKTDDPALRKRLEQSFATDRIVRRTPLTLHISGRTGGPLTVTIRDDAARIATVIWPGPLEAAEKQPLTVETIRDQFARLGDTPFELAAVETDLPDAVMVPRSVLNDLRRRAVAELIERRERAAVHTVAEPYALDHLRVGSPQTVAPHPQLTVLTRTLDQLDAALSFRPAMVYCDFEDVRRYREAVARARAVDVPIGLATLRVLKPGEDGFLRTIAGIAPDAVLIRNLAGLAFFRAHAPHVRRIGDFSLNVANDLTATLFFDEGLERVVPSFDLNWEQLTALAARVDAGRLEAVIHQHMPMFHNEHCVFAATLSAGKDWRDCGRPCDRHKVELRDRTTGSAFPLVADAGCRNTVYNAVPQSAAEYLPRMCDLGIGYFRIDLLRESADEVGPLLESYARVLNGRDDGKGLWRRLRAVNQLGVTRGTLQLV
jgi:putative protease